ncbi:Uncharacterized protein XB16_1906 [Leptospira santarosai]|uniref:Uncharacterized protein n=1 Tax=Leptospira santarosai TaxID=28183 RepID=A0A2P1QTK7_9LEPT|nr:Uncharacterized protein XB16_1906 [Leptospira santarosai]
MNFALFLNRAARFLFFFCILVFFPLQSNSRAPKSVTAAPGSALLSKSKNVRLEAEELSIFCDDECSIKAKYRIHSLKKGYYLFSFVLPASATLEILHDRKRISVVSKAKNSLKELSRSMRIQKWEYGGAPFDGPHVGEFQLELSVGIQEVQISYSMYPGQDETGFGYLSFGDSDFWGVIEYDLWPAKEWGSENFQLTFEMSVPEERSLFLFGRRTVRCFDPKDSHGKNLKPSEEKFKDGNRILTYRFGFQFPDVLRCFYDMDRAFY